MALSTLLRHALYMLAITAFALGIAEASLVRNVGELKSFNVIPGLTHVTLAGAVAHGHKEVEAWVETLAPGHGTPIHRHELEEIFIIVKGSGTVYVAPESKKEFPGEPEAFPFASNSTFSVPYNSVHQVFNTNDDEDLHFYVIISRPPMKSYMYKDWNTPHADAVFVNIPWDKPEETASTNDEL